VSIGWALSLATPLSTKVTGVAWAPGPLILSLWRAWFGTPRGGRTLVELTSLGMGSALCCLHNDLEEIILDRQVLALKTYRRAS
jgi:hypothetical protein